MSSASHMGSAGAAFAETLSAKAPSKFKVELFPSFALGDERQMLVNLALGMITPSFGVNLFAACSVAKISYERIIPAIIPFVIVVFGCLMVTTYFPPLSSFGRDLTYH